MLRCDTKQSVTRSTRADQRRQHLLDTARGLFVANGFHQTGMAQIASASGIKVGQIYRDFASKEAIIAAICEADVTGWLEEEVLDDAVTRGDAQAIRQWISRFGTFDRTIDQCCMVAEIVAEAGRNERVAAIHQAIDGRIKAKLTAALEALAPGHDRAADIALLVQYILSTGLGVKTRRVIDREVPTEALGRFVSDIVERELSRLTT